VNNPYKEWKRIHALATIVLVLPGDTPDCAKPHEHPWYEEAISFLNAALESAVSQAMDDMPIESLDEGNGAFFDVIATKPAD